MNKLILALVALFVLAVPAVAAESPATRLEVTGENVFIVFDDAATPCPAGQKCKLTVVFNQSNPFTFKALSDGRTLKVDNPKLFMRQLSKAQYVQVQIDYGVKPTIETGFEIN